MPVSQPTNIRITTFIVLTFLTLTTSTLATSADIEEPKYALLDTLDEIEIRRYGPTIQAYTSMDNGGFRNLAGYIFGGNSGSEEIAMTAPVATSIGDGDAQMAFTLPSAWTMENLPSPDDADVRLREMPAFTAAVITFSGWAKRGAYTKQLEQLSRVLQKQGITTLGEPILNQYDPPWTLPFMRRNEVMVAIEWPLTLPEES
ncbi:MAG: heme-binding protein [Halioglobus sp.]